MTERQPALETVAPTPGPSPQGGGVKGKAAADNSPPAVGPMEGGAANRLAAFWEDVGNDYAANELTILQICAKHDLTQGQFNYARLQFGWKRRYLTEVSRDKLIKRLFRLLDRTLETIEDNMTTVTETEVTILGKLVLSMGKLIEIETATNAKSTPRQTRDMHDIRRKLVARIEELKRS